MAGDAIAVFTGKSTATLLAEGGSGSWLLSTQNARRRRYLVCVRNAQTNDPNSTEPHRSAFLVGLIKGLNPLPKVRGAERWQIGISEYAAVDIPDAWKGWRNPVRYTSLDELGIDPDTLAFQPAPEPTRAEVVPEPRPGPAPKDDPGLTIPEAKAGLARRMGISPDAIEIVIKG